MSEYHLCAAGVTLREQIAVAFPNKDTASDGWIGDASHQAAKSDHNPDWSAGGVVRAIDVDSDLHGGKGVSMQKLADQVIAAGRAGDSRLSYVIFNRKIASGTYASSFWTWRTYTGSDPHTNHMHVSFKPSGDNKGKKFDVPLLNKNSGPTEAEKEQQRMDDYIDGQRSARESFRSNGKIGDGPDGKNKYFRAGWNDVKWALENLKGEKGEKGDKGAPGVAGAPGASHSHAKVSVAGPPLDTP